MIDPQTGELVNVVSFGLVNDATAYVNDDQAEQIAAACQQQLIDDVAPAWNLKPLSVSVYPTLEAVPTGVFVLRLVDLADQPDSLGYHNAFYSEVECAPIIQSGCWVLSNGGLVPDATVSSVASHELIESSVDIDVNLWVPTGSGDIQDAYEACDPVQGDFYMKGGVQVSNFVFPQWFIAGLPAGAQYDFLKKTTAAFQVAPGGYVVQQTPAGELSEVFGTTAPKRMTRRRKLRLDPTRPRFTRK